MGEQNDSTNKKIPILVKVFAILFYIAAVIYVLFGLVFAGSKFFSTKGTIVLTLAGFVLIAISIFSFLVARNLWKGKKGTRISAVTLSIINALVFIYLTIAEYNLDWPSRSQYIIYALASVGTMLYFLFNKKVKKAFE